MTQESQGSRQPQRLVFPNLDAEPARPTQPRETVVIPIAHPNQSAILAALALLGAGDEDVAGIAKQIEDLLLSDAVCMRVGKITLDAVAGRPAREVLSLFSLWRAFPVGDEAKAEGETNDGKMLARRGPRGYVNLTRRSQDAAEVLFKGQKAGALGGTIPEGRAPVGTPSAGSQEVSVDGGVGDYDQED